MTFVVIPSSTLPFDSFRFPVLTSLHMEPGRDFSWRHHDPEHFYDQLKLLRTFIFIGPSANLVLLLRHTPALVNLHIVTDTELNPLLIGLTATNEANLLVPELKQLTIEPDRWTVLLPLDGPLLTMVASRIKKILRPLRAH